MVECTLYIIWGGPLPIKFSSEWCDGNEAYSYHVNYQAPPLLLLSQWLKPPRIDLDGDLVERGTASEQRAIQATREGTVLAQLFLSKARYLNAHTTTKVILCLYMCIFISNVTHALK